MLCRHGRDPLDLSELMALPEIDTPARALESTGFVARDPKHLLRLYLLTDGKTPRSLRHHSSARVETHTAEA
jgi:hypothetical protein